MHVRRLRPGTVVVGLVFLVTIGCSSEEDAPLDPGVSPFYPGPAESTKATTGPGGVGGPIAGGTATSATPGGPVGADAAARRNPRSRSAPRISSGVSGWRCAPPRRGIWPEP